MQNSGAVFLDRDGVLIEDVHYLSAIGQVRLIRGAAAAVVELNAAGIPVVVVTNQSGVARGYFSEDRITEVHRHLDDLLATYGARVDRYYYCPHLPDATVERYRAACPCRKPEPGMIRRAATELNLDLARSYMIGDKASDLAAGAAAGCKTVLVRTGYGAKINATAAPASWNLVRIAVDLSEALQYVLPAMIQTHRKKSA